MTSPHHDAVRSVSRRAYWMFFTTTAAFMVLITSILLLQLDQQKKSSAQEAYQREVDFRAADAAELLTFIMEGQGGQSSKQSMQQALSQLSAQARQDSVLQGYSLQLMNDLGEVVAQVDVGADPSRSWLSTLANFSGPAALGSFSQLQLVVVFRRDLSPFRLTLPEIGWFILLLALWLMVAHMAARYWCWLRIDSPAQRVLAEEKYFFSQGSSVLANVSDISLSSDDSKYAKLIRLRQALDQRAAEICEILPQQRARVQSIIDSVELHARRTIQ